jgi:hypothetical protein
LAWMERRRYGPGLTPTSSFEVFNYAHSRLH